MILSVHLFAFPLCSASGYFANAQFLSLALQRLSETTSTRKVSFGGARKLTVNEIHRNLRDSLDLALRHFLGTSTIDDLEHPLYEQSVALYSNPSRLPDGSAVYGVLLNSHDLAVFGYGGQRNRNGDGEDVVMDNVQIEGLQLSVNEVPAMYFDQCRGRGAQSQSATIVKGPFGDVLDIRKMITDDGRYGGNPLSDAQIALALHGVDDDAQFGSFKIDENEAFLEWALSDETFPECARFQCNGDIMFHTNKGVIALRADHIEDAVFRNLKIQELINRSPLSMAGNHEGDAFSGHSFCGHYSGSSDGGNPHQMDHEGLFAICTVHVEPCK